MASPVEQRADLVFRDGYRTEDVGEAEQFLCATYTDATITAPGGERPFRYVHDTLEADRFSVNRQATSMSWTATAHPFQQIAIISGRGPGVIELAGSGYDHPALSVDGSAALAPIGCDYDAYVSPDAEVDLVVLDLAAVGRYAGAVVGIAAATLEFTGLVPLSQTCDDHWRATVAHVRDDILVLPEVTRSPLVLDTAFRTLTAAALATFPNTALETALDPRRHRPGTGPDATVSPTRLREVLDYIDVHADRPITPELVAELAGAPTVAVLAGLRRHGFEHPARHLWRARLRGARDDLRATDPPGPDAHDTDTVTDIALRWGFTRVDRFRAAYASAFGTEPEDTLRG